MQCRAVLAGLTVIVAACGSPAAQFTPADETAAKGLFSTAEQAIKTGNFDAWAATFTEDAVFQPANGQAVSGHANMVAWAKALPPMEDFAFTSPVVHGDGNVAYGTNGYRLKMKGIPADTGKQLVVMRRQADGKWAIVAGAFNSNLPLPAPPAAAPAKKK